MLCVLVLRPKETWASYFECQVLFVSLLLWKSSILLFSYLISSPPQWYGFLIKDISLRMVGLRLICRFLDVPVNTFAAQLHVPSLEIQRVVFNVVFLYKVVNDCPAPRACQLSHFYWCRVHRFVCQATPCSVEQYSTVARIQHKENLLLHTIDFFYDFLLWSRGTSWPSTRWKLDFLPLLLQCMYIFDWYLLLI